MTAQEVIKNFMDALNIRRADYYPRVSEDMKDII